MSLFSPRSIAAALAAVFAVASAHAASGPQISVSPKTRIVDKVDNTKLVTRANTHPAKVAALTDLGRVSADAEFKHMFLVLQSSDEQEFALHSLLDEQQDKAHPNYHQWMTPETFGQHFGAASTDITQVTAWMQDAGFSIEQVTKSGRFIEFTGTSAQVEKAFHTQMHRYTVNGEARISNSTDISIPKALAPVVMGVSSLNNFQPKPRHIPMTYAAKGADGQFHPVSAPGATPDLTSGSGTHYIGGADIPILYDSKPLLAAGNNGAGVKIGILGQTDVLLGDIQTYRSVFGLPSTSPNIIVVGNDPGTAAAGDDVESDLDLEIVGAFAPGASVDFYTSGSSYFGGSVQASGIQIIENNADDIISVSYGFGCEQNAGSEAPSINYMWEQAAAQGISVFVSSGDSGPDDCDDGATYGATYSVDILSSTPYDVAVGGTMFNEGTTTGATSYWGPSSGAPYATALSYIPEIVWNEGALDPYGNVAYGGIVAGTSGISILYNTPSWQAGPGVPTTDPTPTKGTVKGFTTAGPHRYVPDVSLAAAGVHDGTIICSEGSCTLDSSGNLLGFGVVGGTSVAAPSFAGVQALINQKNGGRQGLPNYYYYRAAALQSTTNCNAATLPSAAGSTCAFHDAQTGNNFIPSARGGTLANGNYIGWTANSGYDLTVGLGSPDINNLATQWSSITFNATQTAFTLTPTTGPTGQTENFSVTVTPASGTGTPTGDVSIIAQALYGAVGFVTLSGGTASGTFTSAGLEALPAGTYNVYAHYAGDVTYGGSNSPSIQVTIGTSSTTIQNTSYYLAASGALTSTTTFTYGQNVYIDSNVCNPAGVAAGGCNTGTPTGTITYTLVNANNVTLPVLVSPLDSFNDAYFDAGLGIPAYDIKPNYPTVANPQVLPPGTYTVNTKYSGDTTYTASAGTPFTIVVGPATEALTLTTSTATIPSGGTVILNASMATIDAASGGVAPTGTVTFTDTTTNTVLGTGTLTNGAVVFSVAGKLTTAGAHTIKAVYGGDSNYNTATSANVTITVGGTASTITLATTVGGVAATTSQVGQTVALVATVPATATGTVYFYDSGVLLGTAAVSTTTHLATRNQATFTAGTHTITATYGGNTTLDSSTSTATTFIVAKNTPTLSLESQSQNAANTGVALNAVLTPSPNNSTTLINPAPTGAVNFLDGTTVLGSANIASFTQFYTFVANYTTQALKPGTHVLSAQYQGDANFAGVTSNTETINIGLTTLALTLSSNNLPGAAPLTVTVTVTPTVANTAVIGGMVTIYDGTTVVGTATVAAGVATLTISTPTLAPGITHTLSAVYSGDTNYYTSTSNSATVIFGLTTTTLTASSSNLAGGAPLTLTATVGPHLANTTAIGGTMTFYDGTTFIATSPVTAGVATLVISTPTLAPGVTHTFSAVYSGDTNFYTSTSNTATAVFGLTTLTLSSSSTNVGTGISFTLTGTIAPVSSVNPTGTVKFYDGTMLLGTATGPFVAGKATLTTTFSTIGTHTITAIYSGDANYVGSSSTSSINIIAVTPGFTITANPTTVTITRGGNAAIAITATSFGNYSGYGYTTVSGLPAGASYTVLQSPYVFNGVNGSQTYNVFILTFAPPASAVRMGTIFWIPALLLAVVLGWRRKKMPVMARHLTVLGILMFGMLTASGCAGGSNSPVTALGTTTATVTMTGVGANAASPAVTATATVTVTVQ